MSELLDKKETRNLRYDFTPDEIHDLSLQLAAKTKEQQQVEDEKKAANSQFKAKLDAIGATCNLLANQVADGFEYRDVEVGIKYHHPKEGMKTYTRQDNGEEIVEPMESFEFNLFNQAHQAPEQTMEQDPDQQGEEDPEEDFFGAQDDDDLPEYTPETIPKGGAKKGRKKATK